MRLLCWGIGIVLETMDILLVPAGYWSWRGLGAVGLWYPLSSGLGSAWPQAIYIPVTIVNLTRCKFHMPHGCQFWLVCQHDTMVCQLKITAWMVSLIYIYPCGCPGSCIVYCLTSGPAYLILGSRSVPHGQTLSKRGLGTRLPHGVCDDGKWGYRSQL